jgi:hypothetical protein
MPKELISGLSATCYFLQLANYWDMACMLQTEKPYICMTGRMPDNDPNLRKNA